MTVPTGPTTEPSLSELVGQLSSQTSRLVRDEIRLAQKEFQQSASSAGRGAGLISKQEIDQVVPAAPQTVSSVKRDIEEVREARHGDRH